MKFSIITASYRNSDWLKLCIASVADQGVELEHIVQDACSDDGTQDWLQQDKRVSAFIEKDQGMYDAINRGMRRASGDIVAYLNCDEQYTPGALATVQEFFKAHPTVQMLFGDAIVVEADGQFRCYRKAVIPRRNHTMISGNLSILTCSTFFRRSILDEHQLFFDTQYRALGDMDWALRAVAKKIPMATLRHFTSTFTETGENLGRSKHGIRETAEFFNRAPALARRMRHLLIVHHRLRRLWNGAYSQRPFTYSIYTRQNPGQRMEFTVSRPTGRWVR